MGKKQAIGQATLWPDPVAPQQDSTVKSDSGDSRTAGADEVDTAGIGATDDVTATPSGQAVDAAPAVFVDKSASPVEVLAMARQLIRHAAQLVAADACPAGRSKGVPRAVEQVRDLEEVIRASEETKWVLDAAQTTALARYAATGEEFDSDHSQCYRVEYPLGVSVDNAEFDLAPVTDWSTRSAGGRLDTAAMTLSQAPLMHADALAGKVAAWRGRVVARELFQASPQVAARIEAQIRGTRGWGKWSFGTLQRTTRALLQQWQPEAERQARKESARKSTGVFLEDHPDDLTLGILKIIGPKQEIGRLYTAIDELATSRHQAGDRTDEQLQIFDPDSPLEQELLMGQQRFRALRDLIDANATCHYELVLQVPVVPTADTANAGGNEPPTRAAGGGPSGSAGGTAPPGASVAGRAGPTGTPGAARGPDTDGADDDTTNTNTTDEHDEQHELGEGGATGQAPSVEAARAPAGRSSYRFGWGRIPGVGVIHPEVILTLLNHVGFRLTRACLDAKTGVTIETAKAGYHPTAAMRRFLEERDGSCRAPSCERDAAKCDKDHVTPYPQGDTSIRNLTNECRRNHNQKTQGRWTYTLAENGDCHWTSPTGREFTTHPAGAYDDQIR